MSSLSTQLAALSISDTLAAASTAPTTSTGISTTSTTTTRAMQVVRNGYKMLPTAVINLVYSYVYEQFLREVAGNISRLPTDLQFFFQRYGHTITRLDLSFTHQTSGSLDAIARLCPRLLHLEVSNISFNQPACPKPVACYAVDPSDNDCRAITSSRTHSGIHIDDIRSYFRNHTTLEISGATRVTHSGVASVPVSTIISEEEMEELQAKIKRLRQQINDMQSEPSINSRSSGSSSSSNSSTSSESLLVKQKKLLQLEAEERELDVVERQRCERLRALNAMSTLMLLP